MGRDEGEHVNIAGVDGIDSNDVEQEKHKFFKERRRHRRQTRKESCG